MVWPTLIASRTVVSFPFSQFFITENSKLFLISHSQITNIMNKPSGGTFISGGIDTMKN